MRQVLADVQAVILAGGLGTRLRPLTETVPKPLVEVSGRPFLEWQLASLKKAGFRRVLLLTAYLGEQIEKHFGDGGGHGLEIAYAREPRPLGTGGALQNARDFLDRRFFLVNGDSFLAAPYQEMWVSFARLNGQCDAMVSAFSELDQVPVPANLKLQAHSGGDGDLVLAYQANAGVHQGFAWVDSGVYIIEKSVIPIGPVQEAWPLSVLWSRLIAASRMRAFSHKNRFYDIGTPDRLEDFERHLRGQA